MKKPRYLFALSIFVMIGLLLAGCGGQPTQTPGQTPAAPAQAAATPATQAQPSPTPDLIGKAEVKDPEPVKSVKTKTWGEVVINQVGVILKDGTSAADAEKVASELGGQIVGQVEFFGLYQIETKDANEESLLATIAKAKTLANVEIVIPNARVYLQDSGCKACGSLNDPFYGGVDGKAYEMIGVKNAWDIIKASGIKLNDVEVGVMDDGLYTKSDDIGGKVHIAGIDASDSTADPEKDDLGNVVDGGYNHGTMVTHVIAANPDNSGPAGIAGILGDKLTVNVKNTFKGQTKETQPDPNDPTKMVWSDGKSYVYKHFVAAMKQIEAGSTVINCSFGPEKPGAEYADIAAAWKKFLGHVQQKYPKVIFVAAAGNEKGGLDGSNYYPGGIKAPNLVTVGALSNDGSKARFTNYATGDGEVTISAPGVAIPMAVGPDGKTVRSSGTSFSSPMVAGTIALLKGINPDLTCEQIKKILADTAAPGVPGEKQSIPIPEGMGAGVLRVDAAVLKVINDKLGKNYKAEDLLKLATLDGSVAMKDPQNYTVKASLAAVGDSGADVSIELMGEGAIGGSSKKSLKSAGDVSWEVSLIEGKSKPTVRLCRLDTNSCCDLELEVIDMAGTWTGVSVLTDAKVTQDVTIPDPLDDTKPPTVITKEECEKNIEEQKGKENPITMEFKPSSPTGGTVTFVTANSSDEGETPATMPYQFSGGNVVMEYSSDGWSIHFEGKVTAAEAAYTLAGPYTMTLADKSVTMLTINGTFSVSKPKQ